MKMRKLFFTSFLFTSLFVACGDDVTHVVTPSGMETVALGDCSAETLGKMTYVERKGAYVCGDTGWFLLSSRKEKLSCDFESLEDSSGYRMICDGDSVGVIYHGTDGAKGAAGAAGKEGTFAACSIVEQENWIFLQVCGSDTTFLYQAVCGGETFDPKISFCFEGKIFEKPVFGTITDERDSVVYRTVRIGNQIWMAEDLRLDVRGSLKMDGMANVPDTNMKYGYLYDRGFADASGELIFSQGRLYEAESLSVADKAGLCPAGFHLPDSSEWNVLLDFVTEHSQGVEPLLALWASYGWSHNGGTRCTQGYGICTTEDGENRGANGVDLFGFSALPLWWFGEGAGIAYNFPGNLAIYLTDDGWFAMFAWNSKFISRSFPVDDVICPECNKVGVSALSSHKAYFGFVRCVGD